MFYIYNIVLIFMAAIVCVEATVEGRMVSDLDWVPRSDWINVQERGAEGDGVTDDTAALQALCRDLESGQTLYFPPGTYRLTATLELTGPATGTALIGHGRKTRLWWDGPDDAPRFPFREDEEVVAMLKIDGLAHGARYEGLVFDGNHRADIGAWHRCDRRFETEVLYSHVAFLNFKKAGFLAHPEGGLHGDTFATAEVLFRNVLFQDCAVGVSFTSFNDYNYTFDRCEFIRCGTGIECVRGNFYVRNTHFHASSVVDIRSHPEHASSIRRTTSYGSKAFVHHTSSVAPLTIEECHIGGWPAGEPYGPEGVPVVNEGVSMLIFDTYFNDAPDARPPVFTRRNLILSGCHTDHEGPVVGALRGPSQPDRAQEQHLLTTLVRTLPEGAAPRSSLTPHTRFLATEWSLPQKIFDAQQDFGAAGDGRTDDTCAIQRTIDAAREHGDNALAYLPRGNYVIRETIRMEGSNYVVSGAGFHTRLLWRGEEGGTLWAVHHPQHLKLQQIMIGHHDAGVGANAIDIQHTDDGRSHMTYEEVFVFGLYQKKPFERGIVFRDLARHSLVVLDRVQGNLRFTNCARAIVFAPVSYEGSLVIEGSDPVRDGFMGFQTRLSTVVDGGLYLRDNQSLVISDFYMEQSDAGWFFSGAPDLPAGRATLQFAKLHLNERLPDPPPPVQINNYHGEIAIGPGQLFGWPAAFTFEHSGPAPLTLTLLGSKFYEAMADWDFSPHVQFAQWGNIHYGRFDRVSRRDPPPVRRNPESDTEDTADDDTKAAMRRALGDLRRLGQLDLMLQRAP
jgi:hypothetical protein